MEFSLRVGDMSFFAFCKFEIVFFKIVQVVTENIRFEILYVLSIEQIVDERYLNSHAATCYKQMQQNRYASHMFIVSSMPCQNPYRNTLLAYDGRTFFFSIEVDSY